MYPDAWDVVADLQRRLDGKPPLPEFYVKKILSPKEVVKDAYNIFKKYIKKNKDVA